MANICFSQYQITGSDKELDALYNLMTSLQSTKENGNWVGHIVEALNDGEIPSNLYVRGWWSYLRREEDCICFDEEEKWNSLYEAWDFICEKFETLKVFFVSEEEGCGIFVKRDHPEKHWFGFKYRVEVCTPDDNHDSDYFEDLDSAFRFIEGMADVNIITMDDVEALNSVWEEEGKGYISINEFEEV